MFGKASESAAGERHSHSVLQDGIIIRGNIVANGDVRLDGRLEGKLIVSDRLTIGASGVIVADIEAGEATIMGSVQGTIKVQRRLELRQGAKVVGDIRTPVLVIEEGVHFHGNSSMRPEESPLDSSPEIETGPDIQLLAEEAQHRRPAYQETCQ